MKARPIGRQHCSSAAAPPNQITLLTPNSKPKLLPRPLVPPSLGPMIGPRAPPVRLAEQIAFDARQRCAMTLVGPVPHARGLSGIGPAKVAFLPFRAVA